MNRTSDSRQAGEIPALTMTRFAAALGVLWFHYGKTAMPEGPLRNIVGSGYNGVPFFFILSGFILTYVYNERVQSGFIRLRDFYVRRVARIYPIYVLAWALFGIYVLIEALSSNAPTYYSIKTNGFFGGLSLFLLQSWIPGAPEHWNWPSWSLSVEALFYALFPFLLAVAARLSLRSVSRCLIAMLLANIVLQWIADSLLDTPILAGSVLETKLGAYLGNLPLMSLPLFVIGIMLGRLYIAGITIKHAHLWLFLVITISIATLAAGPMNHHGIVYRDMLLPSEFAALIYLLAIVRGTAHTWLGKTAVLLGQASYSLYIIQVPVWGLIWWGLGRQSPHSPQLSIVLAYTVGVTALSIGIHLVVEMPMERLIKRRFGRSQPKVESRREIDWRERDIGPRA